MSEVIFPVYERLQKLGGAKKTGPITAFIHVYLKEKTSGKDKATLKGIAKKLLNQKIVQEVYIVAGEADILLKVRAQDVFELGEFVSEKMREIKGIEKTVTMIILNKVK